MAIVAGTPGGAALTSSDKPAGPVTGGDTHGGHLNGKDAPLT